MALGPATIWGAISTASNNNGGGWNDRGGASTDYSEQDAEELARSNLSISGATLTDDDGGGLFTEAMVGSIIHIVTVGRHEIIAWTDGDNVTLDAAPGNDTGLTGYVGGAVADLEEIDDVIVNGNTIHLKAGTYSAAGNIAFSDATAAAQKTIIGYNATRGDNPTGNDRPRLDMGSNRVAAKYAVFENIRMDGDDTYVMYAVSGYVKMGNCYVRNDSGSADLVACYIASYGFLFDCEMISDAGYAIYVGANMMVKQCYLHDSKRLLFGNDGAGISMENCILDTASDYGVRNLGPGSDIRHCTVYNITGNGIELGSGQAITICNNQIVSCGKGIYTATSLFLEIDHNNYFGNTVDVDGVSKGADATADDPGFTDAGAGDFSGVDLADAFVMRLGVG